MMTKFWLLVGTISLTSLGPDQAAARWVRVGLSPVGRAGGGSARRTRAKDETPGEL